MRAPLSVVIPTLNSETFLPDTLLSLMEGLSAGLIREVIVTDGGSTDATNRIAEDAGAIIIKGTPGRGGQMSRGARAAQGEWLLFLHSDTQLSEGWAAPVSEHLNYPERAAWFRLAFRARGVRPRIVSTWANLRAMAGIPFGDQGLLLSRELYDACGGYPALPLMEDMAMVGRLRGRLTGLPIVATTDASAYQREGWFRRGAGNMLRQLRFMFGADPAVLAKTYSVPEN
ncbi:MAG: TIGR04283 family arsenosugar biosynthesis glycosyltransferase [Paracoccaceae bacterium]|nr:TIGR04283 family arsenosugar biosynthesis glycosyltransferase [Paracoccaceae bacterium]